MKALVYDNPLPERPIFSQLADPGKDEDEVVVTPIKKPIPKTKCEVFKHHVLNICKTILFTFRT